MIFQKQRQGGFTLIELMIVVTIIGILASIAVPAYRDYTIRTRVGESASVYYPVKTATNVFYSTNGTIPGALGSLNVAATPGSYQGDYVASLSMANTGTVTVSLKDLSELGSARTQNIQFIPYTRVAQGASLNWRVSGSAEQKYWPESTETN